MINWYILFLNKFYYCNPFTIKIILRNFSHENIYFKPVHTNLIFSKWLLYPRNDPTEQKIPIKIKILKYAGKAYKYLSPGGSKKGN